MSQQIDIAKKESFFSVFGVQRLRVMLEKLPFIIIVVNSEERVIYINLAGERLYQCDYSDVVNKPLSKLLFISDPRVISDAIAKVFSGETIFNLEWEEEQYYEGRIFWRQGNIFSLTDEDGKIEYAVMNIIDITERVRSEKKLMKSQEQYRLLFEKAPDAILIMKDDQIIGVNPACERIMGYKKEELNGKRIWEVSPEFQAQGISSRDVAEDKINKALTGELQFFKWQYLSKRGRIISTQVSLAAMVIPGMPHTASLIQAIVREAS